MEKLPCVDGFRPSGETARLLAILGPARFKALQEEFGGRRLWIPKPGVRLSCKCCARRARCVRSWRRGGASVSRIAGHLRISPKTVYHILKHPAQR